MNRLKALGARGQSIWLDSIDSALVEGGGLQRLAREDGLGGVTSNPTIFQKAIEGGSEDARLVRLLEETPWFDEAALFEKLAVEVVRGACDALRPLFDAASGADGFVSLEVSPALARDTDGTLREARRLWREVGRPNLMIKVPGTPEGVPAIEALTAEGIHVNVTLLFSLQQYEAVAEAYLRGLSRAERPECAASVASFFVSRVDTLVDKMLEAVGTDESLALRGRIAVANAKAVYRRFERVFRGERFSALAARGARVQRPLWASTGTKNPAYSDVLYVEALIGPDTVNTLPPATLEAYRDHGRARLSISEGVRQAQADLKRLAALGIDLKAVGEELQAEGVTAFAKSYDAILQSLRHKRPRFKASEEIACSLALGAYRPAVEERLDRWQEMAFLARMWRHDPTLWSASPVPELSERLGWLELPKSLEGRVAEVESFADEVRRGGFEQVVLLGMGGSSLAPELFGRSFARPGYPSLAVLDSTHPEAVLAVERALNPTSTLFVVSSKSGTTLETLSLFRYYWEVARRSVPSPGGHFVAITDAGTPLEALARERGFRKVFTADPEVGGRYSALSHFGLVPAALVGADVAALMRSARWEADAMAPGVRAPRSCALALGASLGELALAGRDKATIMASPALEAFPAWIEQLVAESTGKAGKGIVPVAEEPLGEIGQFGSDRFFIFVEVAGDDAEQTLKRLSELEAKGHPVARIALKRREDLGGAFFLLEAAVAAAGAVLGINPFDQPDVELAKQLAKKAMAERGARSGGDESDTVQTSDPAGLSKAAGNWLSSIGPGDYACLQAYLPPESNTERALQAIRLVLRERAGVATTAGYGPRFLHSTGQLHKGGPGSGVFLQIVDEPAEDAQVPESGFGLAALIQAQALGDYRALRQRGRRVLRVNLGPDRAAGLERLLRAVGE